MIDFNANEDSVPVPDPFDAGDLANLEPIDARKLPHEERRNASAASRRASKRGSRTPSTVVSLARGRVARRLFCRAAEERCGVVLQPARLRRGSSWASRRRPFPGSPS